MTNMTSDTRWTDRLLGFVGLFLIGLIGFVADRVRVVREAKPPVPRRAQQR